jgi:fused signal recognition particle receptor
MLGQNSLTQARLFHESTTVDGIILTKMDSTAKGGIIFAIAQELKIPIAYISYGEQEDQISLFNPQNYVDTLLNE